MKRWYAVLIFALMLTGCVENRILDDLQMITVIGYDKADDGSESDVVKGIAVAPQFERDGRIENNVFVESAHLSKEIRSQFNAESSKPLVSGKLQVAIYSREIAETDGIIDLVDTLQRDPAIGSRAFLAIANSDPEEMLRSDFGNVDIGSYIHDVLEHNSVNGMLPLTNLHYFLYYYYSEGNDPFLPLIEKQDNKVKIVGLALFDGDKMVGEIGLQDLFTFKALFEKFSSNDSYSVKLDNGEYAAVYNIASKRNLNLADVDKDNIEIKGEILGIIKEYSGEKLNPKIMKEIQSTMEVEIEEKGNAMIKDFQRLGVDPLGLGNAVRSVTRGGLDQKEWKKKYEDMDITFNMNVNITEAGVTE
ncbi:Ger(x)C family spore germination protein [Pseudalkalibacillus hwajinpoensis]|uniref:Ger(x)C family spore germination protein n=1 Tax=Guptibacillus hwajinpoensis TaxID=208199 RepID=UPI00325B317C